MTTDLPTLISMIGEEVEAERAADDVQRIVQAAVAWRNARRAACAAPMGDTAVWEALGAAETALTEAVRIAGVQS